MYFTTHVYILCRTDFFVHFLNRTRKYSQNTIMLLDSYTRLAWQHHRGGCDSLLLSGWWREGWVGGGLPGSIFYLVTVNWLTCPPPIIRAAHTVQNCFFMSVRTYFIDPGTSQRLLVPNSFSNFSFCIYIFHIFLNCAISLKYIYIYYC